MFQENQQEALLDEGRKVLQETVTARYYYRVVMVTLLLAGINPLDLHDLTGTSVTTLNSWLRKAKADGVRSLHGTAKPGRKSLLSEGQVNEIRRVLVQPPEKYNYKRWTGYTLSDYILVHFNIPYSPRSSQLMMKRLEQEGICRYTT